MKRLAGQTAIVTGASSGIGQGVAIELGKEGANVVINFHSDKEDATDTLEQITKAGSKGITVKADISREEEVTGMFNTAVQTFGTVDIMINNAGIQIDSKFEEMTLQEWRRVIDVNLTGQFICAREAIKEFLRRGIVKERSRAAGKIIFISSVHDIIPWAGHENYTASKGGVMLLMKSLAQEFAPKKIRINSISPGAIKTNINTEAWSTPEAEKKLIELIPYKRVGLPEDIAKVAVFLASDDADYINGETIYVDGGMTLYPAFAKGG